MKYKKIKIAGISVIAALMAVSVSGYTYARGIVSVQERSAVNNISAVRIKTANKSSSEDAQTEDRMLKSIISIMPEKAVSELESNGVWSVRHYEDSETIDQKTDYTLANSNKKENITLQAVFSYQKNASFKEYNNILTHYVLKCSKFIEKLPENKIGNVQAKKMVINFAKEFCKTELVTPDKTLKDIYGDENVINKGDFTITSSDGSKGKNVSYIYEEPVPSSYDKDCYAYFEDSQGSSYLVNLLHGVLTEYQSYYKSGSQGMSGSNSSCKACNPVYADITGDGKDEIITVDSVAIQKGTIAEGQKAVKIVSGSSGKEIYHLDNYDINSQVHPGWMGLYKYKTEKSKSNYLKRKEYLLSWKPSCYQDICEFEWKLFYVNENGKVKTADKGTLSFDINNPLGISNFEVKEYYKYFNNMLKNSELIADTIPENEYGYVSGSDGILKVNPSKLVKQINYMKKQKAGEKSFSKKKIANAKKAVRKYVKNNKKGCTLEKVWYDEGLYQRYEKQYKKRFGTDYVMVLVSDLYAGEDAGNPFEKGVYSKYKWILARNKNSKWKVKGSGY